MTTQKIEAKTVIDWALKLTIPVVVFVLGFSVNQLVRLNNEVRDLNTRVTVIESSRFTRDMAYSLEKGLADQIDESLREIKRCLNAIQRGDVCDL